MTATDCMYTADLRKISAGRYQDFYFIRIPITEYKISISIPEVSTINAGIDDFRYSAQL